MQHFHTDSYLKNNATNYSEIIKSVDRLLQTQDTQKQISASKELLDDVHNSGIKNISYTDSLAFEMKSANLFIKFTRVKRIIKTPSNNVVKELSFDDSIDISSLKCIEILE